MKNTDGVDRLIWLLSCLRAQYWSYQNSHWLVKGGSFYGDHLMFQRLYESVVEQVDTLAEKVIGVHGENALDVSDLLERFNYWVEKWDDVECLHSRGIESEKDVQMVIKDTYTSLKEEGVLSLGMDDYLMALASEHETNQYLLKQTIAQNEQFRNWSVLKYETNEEEGE